MKASGKHGFQKEAISTYVIIAIVLLFINPPVHAVAVFTNPCCPNFVSSLYFTCRTVTDNEATFLQKILFVLIENLIATNFFFTWSFNWIMIFLGLAWIRQELRELRYITLQVTNIDIHIYVHIYMLYNALIPNMSGITLYIP